MNGFGLAAIASKSRYGIVLGRAVAALERLDDVDLGIGEERVPDLRPRCSGVACDVVVDRGTPSPA